MRHAALGHPSRTTLLNACEWSVNELCRVGTTLTFHFFAHRYLAVVAGAIESLRRDTIAKTKLLGLFTGLNTDSFFIKEEHIKRA